MEKLSTLVLRRLADVGNESVAHAIGKSPSKISRFTAGTEGLMFDDLDAFFKALGLEVVAIGDDQVLVKRQYFESLRVLAAEGLSTPLPLRTRADD